MKNSEAILDLYCWTDCHQVLKILKFVLVEEACVSGRFCSWDTEADGLL